jgi:histidinol phosphatase-like PHP family hydrolase
MLNHSISRRMFLGAAGVASTLPFTRLLAQHEQTAGEEGKDLDFPIVDYHVHVEGATTVEHVLALAHARGVKVGIAEHGGTFEGAKTDEDLLKFLKRWEKYPVYRGMQGDGLTWPKMFSKEVLAKLDYILADAMIMPQPDGKVVLIWTPAAYITDDKEEEWMERYVAHNLRVMNEQPIDILANATYLPDDIVHNYSVLWTDERMEKVIETARKYSIAIEISGLYKIPSRKFILKAKSAGVKFSFGSNTHGEEVGMVGYGVQMAHECGLTAKNMFTPVPYDQKPVIRRGA